MSCAQRHSVLVTEENITTRDQAQFSVCAVCGETKVCHFMVWLRLSGPVCHRTTHTHRRWGSLDNTRSLYSLPFRACLFSMQRHDGGMQWATVCVCMCHLLCRPISRLQHTRHDDGIKFNSLDQIESRHNSRTRYTQQKKI